MFREFTDTQCSSVCKDPRTSGKEHLQGLQRSKGRWEFIFNNFKTDQHRHLQVLHQGYSFQHYHLGPDIFFVVKDNPVHCRIFQQYLWPTRQKPVAPVVKYKLSPDISTCPFGGQNHPSLRTTVLDNYQKTFLKTKAISLFVL